MTKTELQRRRDEARARMQAQVDADPKYLPYKGFVRDAVHAAITTARGLYDVADGFEPYVYQILRISKGWPLIERATGRVAVDVVYNAAGHRSLIGVTPDLTASVWMD